RGAIFKQAWSRALFTSPLVGGSMKVQPKEDFWLKNERLKRPMSPHLTIYKPQVTSMLSITHRGTGCALSVLMSAFSIGMLCLPNSYPYYLAYIQSLQFGSPLIFLAKFALAMPFMFHTCNGIRHLFWDLGYGFSLRNLYQTGYLVVGTSLLLSLGIAAI
ncbi:unnamed protein product, partial [Meganyctiphanes norvegica]